MPLHYSSLVYVDDLAAVGQAIDWLEQQGVPCASALQARYRSILSAAAKYQRTTMVEEFKPEGNEADWPRILREAAALVQLYRAASLHGERDPIGGLKDFLRQQLATDSAARPDASLVLVLVAKLIRHGHLPELSAEAGLQVALGGNRLIIVEVRPKSRLQIDRLLEEGMTRLSRLCHSASDPINTRGLLVVASENVVYLPTGVHLADDARSLMTLAFQENAAFIADHRARWQPAANHAQLGVAVALDAPFGLRGERKLVLCQELTLSNSVVEGSEDYELLLRLAPMVLG